MATKSKKKLDVSHILILATLIVAIVFISKYLYDQQFIERYLYGGNISGYAYDAKGEPLDGVAFIIGYPDETVIDSDGYFLLKNIPQGEQHLALGLDGKAVEFDITVYPDKTTNIGNLTFLFIE